MRFFRLAKRGDRSKQWHINKVERNTKQKKVVPEIQTYGQSWYKTAENKGLNDANSFKSSAENDFS